MPAREPSLAHGSALTPRGDQPGVAWQRRQGRLGSMCARYRHVRHWQDRRHLAQLQCDGRVALPPAHARARPHPLGICCAVEPVASVLRSLSVGRCRRTVPDHQHGLRQRRRSLGAPRRRRGGPCVGRTPRAGAERRVARGSGVVRRPGARLLRCQPTAAANHAPAMPTRWRTTDGMRSGLSGAERYTRARPGSRAVPPCLRRGQRRLDQ